MLAKKLVIGMVSAFIIALIAGILAVTLEPQFDGDDELHHVAGGVTLAADPAQVKMESEHQICLMLHITNSGNEPILAWTLDLGKGLYLVKAEPRELLYHKGHAKAEHGNVLVYATTIEPGAVFSVELTLRVLFDREGNYERNPELRLSYARGTKDAQTLAASDLQSFRDTFIAFPFTVTNVQIDR